MVEENEQKQISVPHTLASAGSQNNNCAFNCFAHTLFSQFLEDLPNIYSLAPQAYNELAQTFGSIYQIDLDKIKFPQLFEWTKNHLSGIDIEYIWSPVFRDFIRNKLDQKGFPEDMLNELLGTEGNNKEISQDTIQALCNEFYINLQVTDLNLENPQIVLQQYIFENGLTLSLYNKNNHWEFDLGDEDQNTKHNIQFSQDSDFRMAPKSITPLITEAIIQTVGQQERKDAIQHVVKNHLRATFGMPDEETLAVDEIYIEASQELEAAITDTVTLEVTSDKTEDDEIYIEADQALEAATTDTVTLEVTSDKAEDDEIYIEADQALEAAITDAIALEVTSDKVEDETIEVSVTPMENPLLSPTSIQPQKTKLEIDIEHHHQQVAPHEGIKSSNQTFFDHTIDLSQELSSFVNMANSLNNNIELKQYLKQKELEQLNHTIEKINRSANSIKEVSAIEKNAIQYLYQAFNNESVKAALLKDSAQDLESKSEKKLFNQTIQALQQAKAQQDDQLQIEKALHNQDNKQNFTGLSIENVFRANHIILSLHAHMDLQNYMAKRIDEIVELAKLAYERTQFQGSDTEFTAAHLKTQKPSERQIFDVMNKVKLFNQCELLPVTPKQVDNGSTPESIEWQMMREGKQIARIKMLEQHRVMLSLTGKPPTEQDIVLWVQEAASMASKNPKNEATGIGQGMSNFPVKNVKDPELALKIYQAALLTGHLVPSLEPAMMQSIHEQGYGHIFLKMEKINHATGADRAKRIKSLATHHYGENKLKSPEKYDADLPKQKAFNAAPKC